jgi:3-oxoacyl-[acyl-carrier-protein] synthase-3
VDSLGTFAVIASGHAHPAGVLTNAELEATVPDLRDGWIQRVLGIEERRVLRGDETLLDLGHRALDDALARAGWAPESLDAVICGISFVEDVLPATASLVASGRSHHAIAFDVNAACASWLYSIVVARSLMATDPGLQRVAVLAAEHPTAWADYGDRESCIFWGDSAACILLAREPVAGCFELVDAMAVNDNEFPFKVNVPRDSTFRHDGRYSYRQVLRLSTHAATTVLDRAGVAPSELAAFVGHQSNLHLLGELGERIGVPWEKQWHNVEWAGNQSAAGVATAFSGGWIDHREQLRDGDHVLLTSVGGGYSGGAALLRWRAS